MNAIAICNNDMVYLHWHFERKIAGCLGFNVIRHDANQRSGKGVPLPAMVGFPGDELEAGERFKSTEVWPVQKYSWKDLFAKRGGTYWYEIVPMIGVPGHLKPDVSQTMRTNSVTLNSKRGHCAVFFNRGIISTQAIAHSLLREKKGFLSVSALKTAIEDPDNAVRKRLVGDLKEGVLSLVRRAAQNGGECYCALYELSDLDLIKHLEGLGNKVHIVLSNAGGDSEDDSGIGDSTNKEARSELHELGLDVTDRMMKKPHIGHNKFIVYVEGSEAKAVLCGSTNWTATGLCAQSNNSIIIESAELADDYFKYWKRLKEDTDNAEADANRLQGKDFRSENRNKSEVHVLTDDAGSPVGNIRVWFSPNTPQKSVPGRGSRSGAVPKVPATPPDLEEVFQMIESARQGVLFLAFIPGKPSIVTKLKEVYTAKRNRKELFYLRGAATSPEPASVFSVELYHRTRSSDASVHAVSGPDRAIGTDADVESVAGIYAAFGAWEAELYKIGHAVIHDKILVIDPFTDNSVVVTGSHNLGFKASYSNDENLVIIRNDRAVAEVYAAHVLDVYDHYRWRWKLQQPIREEFEKLKHACPESESGELWKKAIESVGPKALRKAWRNLRVDDKWQDYYVDNRSLFVAEDNFWSLFGGVGRSD
jgi:phosphatidylserine/phosphatidylglycerophosphate/cardiolipin synthase-like enzyme